MTARSDVSTLPARAAYRLWAPAYDAENALSALEDAAVRRVTPPHAGRTLLDVGCGTGRRIPRAGARRAIGVDLVYEMLTAGDVPAAPAPRISADVRALPVAAGCFDLLWCRLVLGHLSALDDAYRELARVSTPDATLIVSDFHPAAAAAGHTRTFRDPRGELHAVEHHVHTLDAHCAAATAAGWRLAHHDDAVVGPDVLDYYARAGALDRYARQRGLPLVLVMAFER